MSRRRGGIAILCLAAAVLAAALLLYAQHGGGRREAVSDAGRAAEDSAGADGAEESAAGAAGEAVDNSGTYDSAGSRDADAAGAAGGSSGTAAEESDTDFILGDAEGKPMVNLARMDGVILTADSTETEDFLPALAADGNAEDEDSRWSSANEPGSPEHWLCLEFPEEQTIAFLRLVWERLNVTAFVLEVSDDGAEWTVCYEQTQAPETNEQTIILEETHTCRYLRLRTTAVSESEENLFVYYQNVSLLEMEVYAAVPMTYSLEDPVIAAQEDGSRTLQLPSVPEGYEIALAGADYEEVIGADGTVYPTLEEKTVVIGYCITRTADGVSEESPAYEITVPACPETALAAVGIAASSVTLQNNDPPALTIAPAEWLGLSGQLTVEDEITVTEIWAGEELGLGEEGYILAITQEGVTICAQEERGMIWGRTVWEELREAAFADTGDESAVIPCGVIRDYPRFSVRGFSIDIGRRFVGVEVLEEIIDALAAHRMNTLGIHLNDNEILTDSGLTDSAEGVLSAYAGFRLESSIVNEEGESLTSSDGYLTDEEWQELTAYGAARGVEVVPEIDMPAHSLSLTRLFPELALDPDGESADELDLGNEEALELAESLWSEYLVGEEALFSQNETVHIGMDEYYGDAEEFRSFMARIIALAQESGHTVRMWGSLGRMDGKTTVPAEGVQVQVWSWEWAGPEETYEAGYTVINSMNNALYIVPGGGYDELDLEALADWEPNRFSSDSVTVELPAFSPRMAGAIYCLWNDNFALGYSDEELFARFAAPLPTLAEKLW